MIENITEVNVLENTEVNNFERKSIDFDETKERIIDIIGDFVSIETNSEYIKFIPQDYRDQVQTVPNPSGRLKLKKVYQVIIEKDAEFNQILLPLGFDIEPYFFQNSASQIIEQDTDKFELALNEYFAKNTEVTEYYPAEYTKFKPLALVNIVTPNTQNIVLNQEIKSINGFPLNRLGYEAIKMTDGDINTTGTFTCTNELGEQYYTDCYLEFGEKKRICKIEALHNNGGHISCFVDIYAIEQGIEKLIGRLSNVDSSTITTIFEFEPIETEKIIFKVQGVGSWGYGVLELIVNEIDVFQKYGEPDPQNGKRACCIAVGDGKTVIHEAVICTNHEHPNGTKLYLNETLDGFTHIKPESSNWLQEIGYVGTYDTYIRFRPGYVEIKATV